MTYACRRTSCPPRCGIRGSSSPDTAYVTGVRKEHIPGRLLASLLPPSARGAPMRRTKIVCTIGPATNSEERIEQLIRSGMNVARLNFSHGTQSEHALVIERLRTISTRLGCSIAILQDLQGPKIRTGTLQGGQPVQLADGGEVTITTRD